MTKEALKLVLEAITAYLSESPDASEEAVEGLWDAVSVARKALAQPEKEPAATVTSETGADITMSWWHEPALPIGTKLYTTPPAAQPCPTCVSLARAVMMDQTGRDA